MNRIILLFFGLFIAIVGVVNPAWAIDFISNTDWILDPKGGEGGE